MNKPIHSPFPKARIPPWERRLRTETPRWRGRRGGDTALAAGRGAVLWYGIACGLIGLGILVLFRP